MIRYILAFLMPPIAVLMCFKPYQFILCTFLTVTTYWGGAIHAIIVVYLYQVKKQEQKEKLDKVLNTNTN